MNTHIPQLTRREFLRTGGVGISSYSLLPLFRANNVSAKERVQPRGGAEICILLFLQGGPSQLDTFGAKEGPWTPADFDIRTVRPGLRMPFGLLPKLSEQADKYAIIQSLEAWEVDHARGTYYLQAGRIFSPARIKEIPSVGSVMAYESLSQRKESDFLPPFIAMNVDNTQVVAHLVGPGMLPSTCAPMSMFSDKPAPFLLPEAEKSNFAIRQQLLNNLDRGWREKDTHRGRIFNDLGQYYESAYSLLNNPKSDDVFTVKPEEAVRYGKSVLGNACIMARNVAEANAGTKFIFISHFTWDMHDRLYDKTNFHSQYQRCAELDPALSSLLEDLSSKTDEQGRRLIDKTLIVCMGEFGRAPGEPNLRNGRDHHRYAAVGLFAGAGIKGGRALGATDEIGARVVDSGWHQTRSIYPEDVLVTMYSAMGIDWTKEIAQTPSGRTFEYIENISPKGLMKFEEIRELFT